MAGDWIKMRPSLLTNPKVNGIARILEESRDVGRVLSSGFNGPMFEIVSRNVMRYVTVSSLLVIWGAANEHTRDGVFKNADLSDIDDMVGIPGFGLAMEAVGWLVYDENESSVCLPNFNEYNTVAASRSASAKSGAERQRAYRERKKGKERYENSDVTSDVTSDRREEIEKSNISSSLRSEDIAHSQEPEPKSPKSRVSITAQQMVATLPGLTAEVASEYLQYRSSKRAKLTPNAWAVIAKEIVKSGMRPDAALAEAMAAGWQGLKASWLANREGSGQQGGGFKTAQEKRAERNAQIFDYEAQMRSLEGITR
jgi:hypothetical protein